MRTIIGHGSCRKFRQVEGEGELSPFGRLLPAETHEYDALALALLADALGPMHAQDRGDRAAKPSIPAGFTIILQLIDHDLTELVSDERDLGQRQVVAPEENPTAANGRTGRVDLDSLYGRVGERGLADPDLFEKDRFILSEAVRPSGGARDIERNADFKGTPDGRRIAEPRNDENKLIVQMHILFARYHNELVAKYRCSFQKAMATTILTWQRIIFADVLPRVVLPSAISRIQKALAEGRTLYQAMNRRINNALDNPNDKPLVAMPVEFAHAAFRLGHSMLRDRYKLNERTSAPLFRTFPAGGKGVEPERDLRGNEPITKETELDYKLFFGREAQRSEPLDTKLPASVFRLPASTGIPGPPISLAHRNIQRGVDFGVPSGQEALLGYSQVYGDIKKVRDLGIPQDVLFRDPSLGVITPLFYYVLREAQELNPEGPQLGPLGSLIVGETILGSLMASGFDVHQEIPDHIHLTRTPRHGIKADRIWTMVELLSFLDEL